MNCYYNAFSKMFDFDRAQVSYMDTDSYFITCAGDPEKGVKQGFNAIVKNPELYKTLGYTLFPNPEITDPADKIRDEKKLLGLAVEKEGDVFYGVSPKCYYFNCWEGKKHDELVKIKGVSLKYNNIIRKDFERVVNKGEDVYGVNYQLKMHARGPMPHEMYALKQKKIALRPLHNKMRVLADDSCAPFIRMMKREDYEVRSSATPRSAPLSEYDKMVDNACRELREFFQSRELDEVDDNDLLSLIKEQLSHDHAGVWMDLGRFRK
jgi:hypothetical protein